MEAKTKITTTKETRIELGREDIISALVMRYPQLCLRGDSIKVSLTVKVPGGGDWSNTELEIGDVTLDVCVTAVTHG